MADFREVLEVSKNSTCFLSFSYCKVKEDLALADDDQSYLEMDWNDNATVGEVADLIDNLSDTNDEATLRIQQLLDTGKTRLVKEY